MKEKHGETKEQQILQAGQENLIMTGYALDGPTAFDLLFEAMTNSIVREESTEMNLVQTQSNTNLSLWCIWNFVNVVYWQLTEMHHVGILL